jgi:hypothetical protein
MKKQNKCVVEQREQKKQEEKNGDKILSLSSWKG